MGIEPLLIALIVLSGAFLAAALVIYRKKPLPPTEFWELRDRFEDVRRRVTAMELELSTWSKEVSDKLTRANDVWRKVQAADYYRRRKDELEEDEPELQPEEQAQGVLQLHEDGGDPRGMSYLSGGVGSDSEEPWRAVRRALARKAAGLD